MTDHEHHHRHAEHITLVIQAPGQGSVEHEFKETAEVENVIRWAADHFKIKFKDTLILDYDGAPLDNTKTLQQLHLPDDAVVILSDNSGGV